MTAGSSAVPLGSTDVAAIVPAVSTSCCTGGFTVSRKTRYDTGSGLATGDQDSETPEYPRGLTVMGGDTDGALPSEDVERGMRRGSAYDRSSSGTSPGRVATRYVGPSSSMLTRVPSCSSPSRKCGTSAMGISAVTGASPPPMLTSTE